MTVVIGTAGHIDHGKTSLLRAVTGIDADRLPEERRRGMTIDVGYAYLRCPDGTELDFVDVPGHDRLVGNMLVGAGEIDAALLVVAADDGIRAQTLEHLELLDAIGIREGLVVITKIDLVPVERVAEVAAAVRVILDRTTLSGSPVLPVSATSGAGLDALKNALLDLQAQVLARKGGAPRDGARLAIDRSFTIKGRGTVVTGSLRGGSLTKGQGLRLEPAGSRVRVRQLQVHGAAVDKVADGGRVALNVTGAPGDALVRGATLTDDPAVASTDRLLVLVRASARLDDRAPAARWPLPAGSTYRLHMATVSVDATLRRGRGHGAALPDGRQVATLRLARAIAAGAGDRLVLRTPSPGNTAAGGLVVDTSPPVGASRRRATAPALVALAEAAAGDDPLAADAARLALHGVITSPAGRPQTAPDLDVALREEAPVATGTTGAPLAEVRRILMRSLRRRATVDEASALAIVSQLLDSLLSERSLDRSGDSLYLPGRAPSGPSPEMLAAMQRLEQALAVPAPPSLADGARMTRCPPDGVRALEATGRIVRVDDDLAWATGTYRDLVATARRLAATAPLSPAALRDATGTSRKYVMALLEDLDRRGVLRRTPAGHLPGPRASADA